MMRHCQRQVRSSPSAVFALLLLVTGCSGKPTLRVDDIRSLTFGASGVTWEASKPEIEAFVRAYGQADIRDDDLGTTPPAVADVVLKNGELMRFWGGSEGIQGLSYRGKAIDLRGQELGKLLGGVVIRAEQGGTANGNPPAGRRTNATPSSGGTRQ